jgi:glycosyltransferase involved in cell wall biosynthesis
LEPAVAGAAKAAFYREADLFVLPSASENFGVAAAEALASETPAICTRGTPWAGLEAEGCGWWVDPSVDALATALDAAMSLPAASLRTMGRRGRTWMARDFSWPRVAADMLDLYRWLAGAGERPATVRLV